MAATDTHSILVDETRAQIAANLTGLNTDNLVAAEWPKPRARWPHDMVVVEWDSMETAVQDNENDLVTHTIQIHFITKREDRESAGQQISDWFRQTRLMLSDRASDRTPFRTDPMPASSGSLPANVGIFSVSWGATSVADAEAEGGWRHGGRLPLIVTTCERAT